MLKSWWAWKLAVFKLVIGSYKVVAGAIIAADAMPGVDLSVDSAIKYWLAIGIVLATFIDGFLDQTINNVRRSRNPLGIDDTQQIGK